MERQSRTLPQTKKWMIEKMTIKGLKKAIGDYQRANKGGAYDPNYGYLMYDRETGEIWTDVFYDLGHNDFKVYESDSIVNVVNYMCDYLGDNFKIDMKTVRNFIETFFRVKKGFCAKR